MIVKKHLLKTAVVFLLGVFGIIISAKADVRSEAETSSLQDKLTWTGGGGVFYADLSHWNLADVTKTFGKPTEVFPLDKAGLSEIKRWAHSIPKDADTVWRYLPKDRKANLVERIIFLRKEIPLMVIRSESDW